MGPMVFNLLLGNMRNRFSFCVSLLFHMTPLPFQSRTKYFLENVLPTLESDDEGLPPKKGTKKFKVFQDDRFNSFGNCFMSFIIFKNHRGFNLN